MIVSFNEIETTILKAARGAGMEWGLAEEAAQAARFLARLGLPFEAPLVNLLSTRAWETPPVLEGATLRPARPDASLCPVRAGAYLSDLGIAGAMSSSASSRRSSFCLSRPAPIGKSKSPGKG